MRKFLALPTWLLVKALCLISDEHTKDMKKYPLERWHIDRKDFCVNLDIMLWTLLLVVTVTVLIRGCA